MVNDSVFMNGTGFSDPLASFTLNQRDVHLPQMIGVLFRWYIEQVKYEKRQDKRRRIMHWRCWIVSGGNALGEQEHVWGSS